MRELKKARYNYTIVSEVASPISIFTNPKTTSLFIESNTHLQKIQQCPALSILNLKDSAVQTIKGCTSLCNLTIENNRGMQTLKSLSVRTAILSECHNLKKIVLDKVEKLQLSGMYNIGCIHAPCAQHITISDMNLDMLPFHLFEAFPNMTTLILDRVIGFSVEDIYSCNLESLTFRECNISSLSGLSSVKSIIVQDCSKVKTISNIKNANTLIIVNCAKLALIETISGINSCCIERCGSLQCLYGIQAVECNILYCFGLREVPYLQIQTLLFENCPFLLKVDVSTSCRSLVMENCYSFEEIWFQGGSAHAHIDLRISLIGDNNINVINEWFVRTLEIKNNNTLMKIKQVQNLYELKIIDCSELVMISNLQASIVSIDQAPMLKTISEVFCISELNLIGCDALVSVKTPLAKLTTVMIHDCINVSLMIDASYLTNMSLINSGMVIPFNIHPNCVVLVENANQLPNTHSTNALPIVNRMHNMVNASNKIISLMHAYLVRNRYCNFLKLKKEDRISDCVICHECIPITEFTCTKCEHMFHTDCLNAWMQIKRVCPLCNAEI